MQASGVCGLGSKGWANMGSKVRASLSPLCFCSSLLSQLHLLLPAGSPLRLSPTHPPTFLLRQRGDCTLSLSQASKHLLAFRKTCLLQSRDEEVSPSGNSRIPAGPGLCVQSEKAQLSVSCRSIQQSGSPAWHSRAALVGAEEEVNVEVAVLGSMTTRMWQLHLQRTDNKSSEWTSGFFQFTPDQNCLNASIVEP